MGGSHRMPSKAAPSNAGAAQQTSASTSRSLLAALRGQEPEAWQRLVSLYAPLVYHWCRKMELADQDAADIFQEVFQSVARGIATFHKDGPDDTFRGELETGDGRKRRQQMRLHLARGARVARQDRVARHRNGREPALPDGCICDGEGRAGSRLCGERGNRQGEAHRGEPPDGPRVTTDARGWTRIAADFDSIREDAVPSAEICDRLPARGIVLLRRELWSLH